MPLFGRKKKEEAPKQQQSSPELPVFTEEMFSGFEEHPKTRTNMEKSTPLPQHMAEKSSADEYDRPIVVPIEMPQPSRSYPQQPQPYPQIMEKQQAPVFVKLDRYHQILHSIDELRRSLEVIKETFDVFSEMERLKADSLKMLQSAIDRVDKKMTALDASFTRPAGFMEEHHTKSYSKTDLEGELATLKKQVNSLKSELEQYA